ncbi:hypothetical protein FKM82_021907 [Ascaphus truei]
MESSVLHTILSDESQKNTVEHPPDSLHRLITPSQAYLGNTQPILVWEANSHTMASLLTVPEAGQRASRYAKGHALASHLTRLAYLTKPPCTVAECLPFSRMPGHLLNKLFIYLS